MTLEQIKAQDMQQGDMIIRSYIHPSKSYKRFELKAAFDKLLAQPATKESGKNWKAPIDSIVLVIGGDAQEFETMMEACVFFTGSKLRIVARQMIREASAEVLTVHADGYYAVIGA